MSCERPFAFGFRGIPLKPKRKNLLPLLLWGATLIVGVNTPRIARAAPMSVAVAPELKQPGPPVRDGGRVLFRFHAPDGAQKVFLAGSFNNYADNVNGAVTDPKYALTDAGDGDYYIRALVKPDVEQYKFVVLNANGGFDWLADPQVQTTDKDGNSVTDFGKIGSIPPSADREGAPVRANGEVLFRFRAPEGTQKVFLAGSFNNYGDNQDGVVSDDKYALTPDKSGLHTGRENIGATTEKYKFVVVGKDGKTIWVADPNVEATDENGNSVVDFGAIEKLP